MYPYIPIAGLKISMYKVMFCAGLATVPLMYLALRKKFDYTKKQALLWSLFTLVFGFLSAMLTACGENGLLWLASNGEFDQFETLRIYGIPIFLPLFYLGFCKLFGKPFRDLTDYLAPSVYSLMTLVKFGCACLGCCFGEADEHGMMNQMVGYRTFPVQIYDSLSCLAITAVCIVLIFTLRKKRRGLVYPIGGMLYAAMKGFWENYRAHNSVWEKNFLNTGYTFWQFWMIVLFIGCLAWLVGTLLLEKKGKPDFDIGYKAPRVVAAAERKWQHIRSKQPTKNKKNAVHKKKK